MNQIILVTSFLAIFGATELACANSDLAKPLFLPGASVPRTPIAHSTPPNAAFAPPVMGMLAPSAPNQKLADPYFNESLTSYAQFDSMASLSEGLIKGAGVKFLIDNRTMPGKVYFVNGNYLDGQGKTPQYVQFHYYFAQNKLGITLNNDDFNSQTYFTNDLQKKHFIAGTLQSYEVTKNGSTKKYLGIQFYPQDSIAEGTVAYAAKIVSQQIQFKDLPLYFVSYGTQQTFQTILGDLKALNIQPISVEQIYAGIPYIPMQTGTTLGVIRFQPKGSQLDDLAPQDIPVFDELPLDLSVVSGVITTLVQDAGAHVNLKSKERNTPNMVLKDPAQIAKLKNLDGKPVRLTVDNESFKIDDKVTQADVDNFISGKLKNKKWVPVPTGTDTEISLFDDMAKKSSPLQLAQKTSSYGGKGSKLSMLAHIKMVGIDSEIQKNLQYRLTPTGFAIPVHYYINFVNANPQLKSALDQLTSREMGLNGQLPPSPSERVKLVSTIQNLFYTSEVPADLAKLVADQTTALKAVNAKWFPNSPLKKVKIRSSANAEDIPQFDGAGLHDSFSAKIEQFGDPKENCKLVTSQDGVSTKQGMEPETMMCGIKGVYASLWNKRAIEERNFARIDQRTAAMALAVNTAYDFRNKTEKIVEVGNAVIVTRVINAQGVYGYRISTNTSENLVTNPTPGTQSEIIIASFLTMTETPSYSFLQYAKTAAESPTLTKPLLDSKAYARMLAIAQAVELNYCKNVPTYYPKGYCPYVGGDVNKPSSLDMEFKVFSNGEVIIKQVREFSGK